MSSPTLSDLAAALHQTQQQMQQMQMQHQQQMAAVQQQQQQQFLPTPIVDVHAAALPRNGRPRLPAPPSYDGRSSTALDGWLRELQQQFDWYRMTDDAERLQFVGALLKGVALDWWANLVDSNGAAQSESTRPTTYADFATRLRSRFQPINSAQTARTKLDSLRQGPKQSTNDYISEFRTLLVRVPDMSEGDRVHRFITGLRPAVATQLRVQGVTTLDAAIAMAARIGSIAEYGAVSSNAFASTPASASSAPADMDLSNVEGLEGGTDDNAAPITRAEYVALLNAMKQQRSKKDSKGSSGPRDVRAEMMKRHGMTKEQVQKHFDEKLCFNCSRPGHSSLGCPNPSKRGN